MASVLRQHREIELRAFVRLMHPHLPRGAFAPECDQWRGKAVVIEKIECGRMEGRSAQIALHDRLCFNDRARPAEIVQPQRRRETDRSRANDQDAFIAPAH